MMDKDPTSFTLLTYGWVWLLSCWGGVVTYIRKVRAGVIPRYSLMEFVGELCTSGFAGVLTFYLCQASSMSGTLTAVFVGISGHMGSRLLFLLENRLKKWLDPPP